MTKYRNALLCLLAFAIPCFAQDFEITAKGGKPKIVIQQFPFALHAPPLSKGFFDWETPTGVKGVDKVEQFDVTTAPKGDHIVRLRIRQAIVDPDTGEVLYVTKFGTYLFTVGDIAPPPPTPTPTPLPVPPAPVPPPAPAPVAPIQVPGKRAIIIYKDLGNGKTSMSEKQEDEVYGATLTKYLTQTCTKVEGTAEFRIWPDTIPLQNASETWRQVMGRTRTANNWIIISDYERNQGIECELPNGDGAILALCKKYLD